MELSTNLSFEDLSKLNTGVSLPEQEESREYNSQAVIDFIEKCPERCEEIFSETFSTLENLKNL